MTEAELSKYIYNKATKFGALVVKIDTSHRGWPDRLILYNGKCLFIEVKSPTGRGKLSKLQSYVISEINKHGFLAVVVDNKIKVDSILNDFFNN